MLHLTAICIGAHLLYSKECSALPLDLVAGMRMLVTTNKPFGNMLAMTSLAHRIRETAVSAKPPRVA